MTYNPTTLLDLENLQALYDRSRFLDAYEKTKSYWDPATNVSSLSKN